MQMFFSLQRILYVLGSNIFYFWRISRHSVDALGGINEIDNGIFLLWTAGTSVVIDYFWRFRLETFPQLILRWSYHDLIDIQWILYGLKESRWTLKIPMNCNELKWSSMSLCFPMKPNDILWSPVKSPSDAFRILIRSPSDLCQIPFGSSSAFFKICFPIGSCSYTTQIFFGSPA